MKTSDLIKALQEGIDKHGDLEIVEKDWSDSSTLIKIKENLKFKPTLVKEHYDAYYRSDKLRNNAWGNGKAFKGTYQSKIERRANHQVFIL